MGGIDNNVIYGDNVDFTGSTAPSGQITSKGQLSIGTGASPAIKTGIIKSPDNSLTIDYTNPNITIITNPSIVARTITPDLTLGDSTGVPIYPTLGNWDLLGQEDQGNPVIQTRGGGSTIYIEDLTKTSAFVVDPSIVPGTRGTDTDINSAIAGAAAAMAAAGATSTTVFLKPGVYTQSVLLFPGVNLAAYDAAFTPGVKIKGNVSMISPGIVTLSGIAFETNGDYTIDVNQNVAAQIYLINCTITAADFRAIRLTSTNTSSYIRFTYCWFFCSDAGHSMWFVSGGGGIYLFACNSRNTGGTTVSSAFSSNGILRVENCNIRFPITTTGTGRFAATESTFNTTVPSDSVSLTLGGDGSTAGALANYIKTCNFLSGTASAVVMSANLNFHGNTISSSNALPIDGTGTLFESGTSYVFSTFPPSNTSITMTRSWFNGGHYIGDFSGVSIPAGCIGEIISASVAYNAGVALTVSGTVYNVTSISLTPGFWDVTGIVQFTGITTGTYQVGSVGKTSATISSASYGQNTVSATFTSTTANDVGITIPAFRIGVASVLSTPTTLTVYLIAQAGFSVGTPAAYGSITAVRIA